MEIKTKRVYEAAENTDGIRILIDKFWPRGIRKDDLKYDIWVKNISPSDRLGKLLHENPEANWDAFVKGYLEELNKSSDYADFINKLKGLRASTVTLLYSFKDTLRNHANVLKMAIEKDL